MHGLRTLPHGRRLASDVCLDFEGPRRRHSRAPARPEGMVVHVAHARPHAPAPPAPGGIRALLWDVRGGMASPVAHRPRSANAIAPWALCQMSLRPLRIARRCALSRMRYLTRVTGGWPARGDRARGGDWSAAFGRSGGATQGMTRLWLSPGGRPMVAGGEARPLWAEQATGERSTTLSVFFFTSPGRANETCACARAHHPIVRPPGGKTKKEESDGVA